MFVLRTVVALMAGGSWRTIRARASVIGGNDTGARIVVCAARWCKPGAIG